MPFHARILPLSHFLSLSLSRGFVSVLMSLLVASSFNFGSFHPDSSNEHFGNHGKADDERTSNIDKKAPHKLRVEPLCSNTSPCTRQIHCSFE